ncbi:MAG: SIS domain-containing protein [Cellulomonas sp.]
MSALRTAADELDAALGAVDDDAFGSFVEAFPSIEPGRIFFAGQGRSGLCAQMAAMRFMHLGFDSHLTSEATAPSVRHGDTLVVVSASGRSAVSVASAQTAHREGASVLVISSQHQSPLRALADHALVLPAAPSSAQFGGTLFEQSALVVLDSIVLALMARSADAGVVMAFNHTNLET